jgi:hypothetical protein
MTIDEFREFTDGLPYGTGLFFMKDGYNKTAVSSVAFVKELGGNLEVVFSDEPLSLKPG